MLTYNVELEGKTVLVTGAAGFIGSFLIKRLFSDFQNIKITLKKKGKNGEIK